MLMTLQDQTEFGRQIVAHLPALRRYASRLLRQRDQIDDLVQDCVERALTRRALYREDISLAAWLFTIMRHLVINRGRRQRLEREHDEMLSQSGQDAIAKADQIDRVAIHDHLRLLDQLSTGEQQAIRLVGLLDLSYDVAAQITGLPAGTVKSHLSRGRKRLRQLSGDDAA